MLKLQIQDNGVPWKKSQDQLDNPECRHTIKSPSPKVEIEEPDFNFCIKKKKWVKVCYCPHFRQPWLTMPGLRYTELDRSSY